MHGDLTLPATRHIEERFPVDYLYEHVRKRYSDGALARQLRHAVQEFEQLRVAVERMDLRLSSDARHEADKTCFLSQCERYTRAQKEPAVLEDEQRSRSGVELGERAREGDQRVRLVHADRIHYVAAVEPGVYKERVACKKDIVYSYEESVYIAVFVETQDT